MNVQEILKVLLEHLQTIARSETVVGNPIQAGDTTLIPLSRLMLGFGVGGTDLAGDVTKGSSSSGRLGGAGTGGGVSVEPVGFIVVHKDNPPQLLSLKGNKGQLAKVIDLVPDLIEAFRKGTQCAKAQPEE